MAQRTPKKHIDAIKSLCDLVERDHSDLITQCKIENWGRFSNFTLSIHVDSGDFDRYPKRQLTQRINNAIDTLLSQTGAHRRKTHAPIARKAYCELEQCEIVVGYSQQHWEVDVDFYKFNPATNTFIK